MVERVADSKAVLDMVAFKLKVWSWKLTSLQQGGLTTCQFVRYQLMQLKLSEDLICIRRAHPKSIASVVEIMALKPELRPTA